MSIWILYTSEYPSSIDFGSNPIYLQIIDEKSLIKTYQNEIRSLKEELEQFSTDIATVPESKHTRGNDVILEQKVRVRRLYSFFSTVPGPAISVIIIVVQVKYPSQLDIFSLQVMSS